MVTIVIQPIITMNLKVTVPTIALGTIITVIGIVTPQKNLIEALAVPIRVTQGTILR